MADEGAGKAPVVIVAAETQVTSGTAAQEKMLAAAQTFGNLLRSTYGPRGLDKMLHKTNGANAVTNDGAKIIAELMVKHPAAKMFVSMAEAQENACGDGVTGTLLVATELLLEAGRLLEKGLHPLMVIDGYAKATTLALEALEAASIEADPDHLLAVARTAMTGKAAEGCADALAAMVLEALETVGARSERVTMHRIGHGSLADSGLLRGIVVRRRVLLDALPERLESPLVALIHGDLALRKQIRSAEIEIDSVESLEGFLAAEEAKRDALATHLMGTGAMVFLCTGTVDKGLLHRIMRGGGFAAGELDDSELRNASHATGARIVELLTDLQVEDLGRAGRLVTERRPATDQVEDLIRLEACPEAALVTFEIGGASELAADEAIRAIHDALRTTGMAMESGRVLHGGGAAHMAAAMTIRTAAEHEAGRARLAMEAFARALEVVPTVLAENAGADPLDRLLELRSAHRNGDSSHGIDRSGAVGPTPAFQGLSTVARALEVAADTCATMLRIDQVVSARGD